MGSDNQRQCFHACFLEAGGRGRTLPVLFCKRTHTWKGFDLMGGLWVFLCEVARSVSAPQSVGTNGMGDKTAFELFLWHRRPTFSL